MTNQLLLMVSMALVVPLLRWMSLVAYLLFLSRYTGNARSDGTPVSPEQLARLVSVFVKRTRPRRDRARANAVEASKAEQEKVNIQ